MQTETHNLAKALEHYEQRPYDSDTAESVDDAAERLRAAANSEDPTHPNTGRVLALLAVVQLALDEDGFGFIPAARVLCAAVEREL